MTALLLEPRHGRGLDLALASVERASLVRRMDGTYADAPGSGDRLMRALAYAGIHAVSAELGDFAPDGVCVKCADLAAVPRGLVLTDLVTIGRVPLGLATAHVLRRRFSRFRDPSADAVQRCAHLLRDENALFWWTRDAWIRREDLRELRRRCRVRPGRSDGHPLRSRARLAWASEGLLARWAFA